MLFKLFTSVYFVLCARVIIHIHAHIRWNSDNFLLGTCLTRKQTPAGKGDLCLHERALETFRLHEL